MCTLLFSILSILLGIFFSLGSAKATGADNDVLSAKYLPVNCNEAVHLEGRKANNGIISQLLELWLELKDFDGVEKRARHGNIAIADENGKHALNILRTYSATACDPVLGMLDGVKFSTFRSG